MLKNKAYTEGKKAKQEADTTDSSIQLVEHNYQFIILSEDKGADYDSLDIDTRMTFANTVKLPKKLEFGYSKTTLISEDDQLTFREHCNYSFSEIMEIRKDIGSQKEASAVKETDKFMSGYSTLKTQIEDLKAHLLQLKGENVNPGVHPQTNKQKKNYRKLKTIEGGKLLSSAKKAPGNFSRVISSSNQSGRSISNSKRTNSQKQPLRNGLTGRAELNGSIQGIKHILSDKLITSVEANGKSNQTSSKKEFENLYSMRYSKNTKGKLTAGQTRSEKPRSKGGLKSSSGNTKTKSKETLIDQILDVFPKPGGTTKKRTADILSLVNINNLYSAVKPPKSDADPAFKKTKNSLSNINRSCEKINSFATKFGKTNSQLDLDSVYQTTRIRSKRTNRDQKASETERYQNSNIKIHRYEGEGSQRKTDRSSRSRNPLPMSLKKWDLKSQKLRQGTTESNNRETDTDGIRNTSAADSGKQIMTRSSMINPIGKQIDRHKPKNSPNTKCSTPVCKSMSKANHSDLVGDEGRPGYSEKQRIISYLSKNQEDIDLNYNVLLEWEKRKNLAKGKNAGFNQDNHRTQTTFQASKGLMQIVNKNW